MINLTKIIAAVLVLLALALGGYAWWLSHRPAVPVLTSAGAMVQPAAETFPITVTTQAVAAGQPLTAAMLRVAQLPINPSGALHDVASATGRIPVADIGVGTPLLESQLVSGLALRLAVGERAVAVKADEVMGVGGRVRPGDFVDVFFLLKTDGREIDRGQSRLLLARQRVLAFGTESVDGPPVAAENADGRTGAQAPRAEAARTAVLAVAIQDVARLTLGEASGRLMLALRHPTDTTVPDESLFAVLPTSLQPLPAKPGTPPRGPLATIDQAQAGLNMADLASGGTRTSSSIKPVAVSGAGARRASNAPRPAGGTEVEVIRGDKRETLSY
jgi:pilus assembly protein CpaB